MQGQIQARGYYNRGDARVPQQSRPDAYRDGNRGVRPDLQNGRPGYDQRGNGQRGDAQRNWRGGDRRDGNWHGNNGNRGGAWNRDWRHDNRYNWSDYRRYHRDAFHLPRYYAPYGWSYGYRRFSVGFRLESVLFGQNYWIDDPYAYQLPPAYGEYRWVRYYNDALLVDIYSGEVVDTVYDIFW
ncbi:MAG: RcnB family protein [Pseudomonadota bacterium]|nr:RcnB family protein [Pseudomonadota bacterium]